MSFIKNMALVAFVLVTTQAFAGETTIIKIKNNELIDRVVIEEITDEGLTAEDGGYSLPDLSNDLGQIITITDKLIALGQKIWKIIEANKPVVTVNMMPHFNVLPRGVENSNIFERMYGWSEPTSKKFHVSYKNGFNSTVVDLEIAVITQYAGKDPEGKGLYLSNVSVLPSKLSVAWGYTFNASSTLIGINNVGTNTDPIASAMLQIDYTVKTSLKETREAIQFYVDGKGTIKAI